jgi:probable rRNA maturation factor
VERLHISLVDDVPAEIDARLIARIEGSLNDTQEVNLEPGEVNIKFVDDATIASINKDYSGQDKPTDVLSFSYIEDGLEPVEGELGDVVVSLDTARRQANEYGLSLSEEVATLILHGTLHILGYDHAAREDQVRLDHLQATILEAANIKYRRFAWE